MRKVSRRTFLKLAGASAATTAAVAKVSAKEFRLRSLAEAEELPIPGLSRWVRGVCLQCEAGCGIRVRVVDGRAVKIEGNPDHPINKGALCPKGQAGLQVLYDPDRIRGPLRRVGERGSGQWQPITWEEAIGLVAQRLGELRARGEAHTVALVGGLYRGLMRELIDRFLKAYGSPNHLSDSLSGSRASRRAHYYTQGLHSQLAYDWDEVNYVISFGASFIEAWRPTTRLLRAFGHMRRGRPGRRAKLVQVDPRFSISAAKADEWVSIRPGTDGALALGLAHVIIAEGRYDHDFIADRTFGFEDWADDTGGKHLGFKTLVLRDYSPEAVSGITGVGEETIVRLAREFATNRPALAVGERGAGAQTNGLYNRMAIHCLNALIGSIGARGGVLVQEEPPFTPLPPLRLDAVAQRGLAMPRLDGAGSVRFPLAATVGQALPENIINEIPYRAGALLLYYSNPLFSGLKVEDFYRAFKKVPFIVSFSPFMDESASQADLVLPDATYLERWQDDPIPPSLGFPAFGLRQPVVPPLYDTRNSGDVIIKLAQAIGGTVAAAFPWASFEELLKERVRGVQQARRGSIVADDLDGFWERLLEAGGWWDVKAPPRPLRFATPSGRFEFYSQRMKQELEAVARSEAQRRNSDAGREMEAMLLEAQVRARGDELYLPHYEPPRLVGEEADYPLYLNTYKTMTRARGWGANQPWLQEIYGLHVNEKWGNWLEINPQTARRMGIGDGAEVWVESPLGRIRAKARHYPGARPDVVSMPYEFGHRAFGRWAKGRGENPNRILANQSDRLAGQSALTATRVKVYPA